jgi:hypothetical protein
MHRRPLKRQHQNSKQPSNIFKRLTLNAGRLGVNTGLLNKRGLIMDSDRINELISDNDIFDMTDRVYWNVINFLGIEDDCVEIDPDTDGTRNTEHGALLYNVIEAALFDKD